MSRTNLTYPRTPLGGVYIPGAKRIEGATGDTARTTSGWIENEKYHYYAISIATAVSAEFDTAVTRTGTKTLKLSATDTTGAVYTLNLGGTAGASVAVALLQPHAIVIKPSTSYVFTVYAKTLNAVANSPYAQLVQFNSAGTRGTITPTNKLSGTNDWTLLTASFTSDATATYMVILLGFYVAGAVMDTWFDVNSLTLTEVKPRTVLTYPRTPVGGVYIPGAKSIEGATGDTATTTSGTYIENRKYGWYLEVYAGTSSAEFDTAVTRTGAKTLKVSTTNATGSNSVSHYPPPTGNARITLKPNTSYTLRCYVKTLNVQANGVYLRIADGIARSTNILSGTNDWTLCTVTWTTGATPVFQYIHVRMLPGAVGDCWVDVNSMTLTEVLPRNPVV